MKRAGVRVGVGTAFAYDGEIVQVIEMRSVEGLQEVVTKDVRTQSIRRFALEELMHSDRARLLNDDLEVEDSETDGHIASVIWSAAPEPARRKARERAAHVREVLTGYRSGCEETALPDEPRSRYRPALPRGQRVAAKAKELNSGCRTVERWMRLYLEGGEAALVPKKAVQSGLGSRQDPQFRQTALEIMIERTDMSKPTKTLVINHTRARLVAKHGEGAVALPSPATANRILLDLEDEYPTYAKSAKLNRDIAARPIGPYGKLLPTRPGEYMLMDTTHLDVFAIDPQTLRWVGVDLTVAMDWYSRCITGLRLTPVSTKAIDAASVLYQSFRPPPAGRDWPLTAVWPPHGVPRSVLVERQSLDPGSVLAASPAIVPETLVVDHGHIFIGELLNSVCERMGISVQPARLRIGRDKGPIERFFRTIRQGLLQELPGYKGPDVYSRGLAPEQEAFFYLDELEAIIREWVAVVYHHRPHDGVGEAGLWALRMSPAQMFEHGIARAGYIEAPRDPNLAYQFLKVEWRTIQHYGVEINHRKYSGGVFEGYHAREKSPFKERNFQWPIHVNPDDIRQVYFFDWKNTRLWHTLVWTLASALDMPFCEDALLFARQEVKSRHRYFDDKLALAELLERRKLSQGATMAERRTALRMAREQSSLSADLPQSSEVSQLPAVLKALSTNNSDSQSDSDSDAEFVDDLDDDPAVSDDDFYSEAFEDVWPAK